MEAKNTEDEKGVDQKDELRKKFEEKFTYQGLGERWVSQTSGNEIFDFFYSEIEKRDKRLSITQKWLDRFQGAYASVQFENLKLGQELSSLSKAMEAADELANLMHAYHHAPVLTFDARQAFTRDSKAALDNYNKLKEKIMLRTKTPTE